MDKRQFAARTRGILLILAAMIIGFGTALYNLQIVEGAKYREQATRKTSSSEVVPAARGQILDRYGRVLVSNRTTYQVTLDTGLLGEEAQRNATLLKLLEVSRAQDVIWPDSLPISGDKPFRFTEDWEKNGNFQTFLEKMRWTEIAAQGADALVDKMRAFFLVDESVSPADGRALLGVLYELRLRSTDIVQTAYVFTQDVSIDFVSVVKEQKLTGVMISPTTVRQYNTAYAAHLLGRVGLMDSEEWKTYKDLGYAMNDTVGKDGVERAFESYLRGEAGVRDYETNAAGKVVSESWRVDSETGETLAPQPGENVMLTLDIRLQEVAERTLAENVPGMSEQVQGAAAVVMDMSGGVLAMASYPTFDIANIYKDNALYQEVIEDPLKPMFNRAIMGAYSPGSTFKMVTATAGLEEGLITPSTKIVDTGVYKYYTDYQPACWYYRQYRRTHGAVNVSEALRDSCNIFFYDVGRRLGIDTLGRYAQLYGLGQPTGLEIPETVGVMASPEYTESMGQTWYSGLTLPVAIGQENSRFTPLQLANYVATLVNGGERYSAHLLKEVKSSDFSQAVAANQTSIVERVKLEEKNLNAIKYGMWMVGNGATTTARAFQDCPVVVGAKTGSAQVSAESEANGVFVCFAPYDDPQIAVALVVEKAGGGSALATMAADIVNYYFHAEETMEGSDVENTLLR